MEAIVDSAIPHAKLIEHDGKSNEFVLKVNGRTFGAAKIQNEVGCLQQLEKHCQHVPSPRVIAWSEDGGSITFTTPRKSIPVTTEASKHNSHGGWILMTRVPGIPVRITDMSEDAKQDLGRQMANLVAEWRRDIPAQVFCGNIKLRLEDNSNPEKCANDEHIVQGIVMDILEPLEPLRSLNFYHKVRLAKKMQDLATNDTYASNRHLLPILQRFLDNDLPEIKLVEPLEKEARPFLFTHYDLSPRNILITEQPLKITGIVDFEFSGFFSPTEEFLNDYVNNGGDWPPSLYAAYQERLEENGIATPMGSMDRVLWNRNYWLEVLLNHVAPWWLPGDYKGEKLVSELKNAESTVIRTIQKVLKVPGEQIPAPQYGQSVPD